MIFLLEDDPKRVAWFESLFTGRLLAARTVEAGLRLLEERGGEPLEFAFLDHDLELAEGSDDLLHSGTMFVNKVLTEELRYPGLRKAGKVVIHSMNPVGASGMLDALLAAGIDADLIPYHQLQRRLKVG